MQNKLIVNIIAANLLWSFIPVIVEDLFLEVSIIMVIFLRFLISGLVLLTLALIFVVINNRKSIKAPISIRFLFKNLLHKNRRFFDIRNISYYFYLGFFGVILNIIFFFLTLKTTSITFTMIGFLLSVILIAFYEKGVNFEKFDIFKVLYIIILFFSIIILILVGSTGAALKGRPLMLNGIIYLLVFSIAISFLYIIINRDAYSTEEIKIVNQNKNYKIPRFLIKMSISFLMGVLCMIPVVIIIYLLPIETDLTNEITTFFAQFRNIFLILGRWELIFLIIFSTIVPYLLIFTANANWRSRDLTYSQWSSILNLIDPMGSIIFSVIMVNEYFPLELLIIIIFLLVFAFVFRYSHEVKNLVQAFLLLRLKKGSIDKIALRIFKYYGITSVYTLVGTHDLFLNVKLSSIKDFYNLINLRLKPLKEIEDIEILFINKIEKIPI
ncbi:MAG: EamA family transporter [Promethearchaeota archaeon]|nr:MAG: EamA family transporter [Candidatus Lokiarchaeota archaeon]